MSNINFFRVLQNFIATGDAPDPTDWTEVRSADLNPPLVIPSAGHFRPDGSVYFLCVQQVTQLMIQYILLICQQIGI